jgi:hypothetical protein
MTNPLTDIIPAAARKYVYAAFVLAGIVLGACQVAGVDTGKAAEILAYLGSIGLGATAASNVASPVALKPAALDVQPDATPFHEGN